MVLIFLRQRGNFEYYIHENVHIVIQNKKFLPVEC